MKSIILYESKAGCTQKCAEYVQKNIEAELSSITMFRGDLNDYENIILMSPVYMGKVNKKFKELLSAKKDLLLTKRLIMVFITMNDAAFDSMVEQNIDKELKEHAEIVNAGGAYNLEKLNFIERRILKSVARISQSSEHIKYDNLDKIKI